MPEITKNHLDFVEHAKRVFEKNPSYETLRHPTYDNLLAIRWGADGDCILVHQLGTEIANFVQIMEPCPMPRKAVKEFSFDMEKQLKANEHKGGWNREHVEFLSKCLWENFEKLTYGALKKDDRDKQEITKLCANIANFAMMIADNEGKHL
jgi:hypothetical protein